MYYAVRYGVHRSVSSSIFRTQTNTFRPKEKNGKEWPNVNFTFLRIEIDMEFNLEEFPNIVSPPTTHSTIDHLCSLQNV